MRYFHSGFGEEDPGILGPSDSENEPPEPAGLGVPNGTHAPMTQELSKPEKRKYVETNGVEGPEPSPKKHKKHRTPEEIQAREERKAKKEKRRREKERTSS
jgi:hypothetical protein